MSEIKTYRAERLMLQASHILLAAFVDNFDNAEAEGRLLAAVRLFSGHVEKISGQAFFISAAVAVAGRGNDSANAGSPDIVTNDQLVAGATSINITLLEVTSKILEENADLLGPNTTLRAEIAETLSELIAPSPEIAAAKGPESNSGPKPH